MNASRPSTPETATGDQDAGYEGFGSLPVDQGEEEAVTPAALQVDDHHMQVRALNFWAGLLGESRYPLVEDLAPGTDPDLGPSGILLDFSAGRDALPSIAHLGQRLAAQCGIDREIPYADLNPGNALLAGLADYCAMVFEKRGPRDFEGEFDNGDGQRFLYRGILLPFSMAGEEIDHIFAVINWSAAEQGYPAAEDDTLELDQLFEEEVEEDFEPGVISAASEDEPVLLLDEVVEEPVEPLADFPVEPLDLLPSDEEGPAHSQVPQPAEEIIEETLPRPVRPKAFDPADGSTGFRIVAPRNAGISQPMALREWLEVARERAAIARQSEERTRAALYMAIGCAYDFSLAAIEQPDAFAQLLQDAGIVAQDRAPMTPVVKLVFGLDYDKTRLTEYATALYHAHRIGIARGTLGDYLAQAQGGLKAIVGSERALDRATDGKSLAAPRGIRATLVKKLLDLTPLAPADLPAEGEEFALVLARRLPDGSVAVLGEIPRDSALLERAARKLIGKREGH